MVHLVAEVMDFGPEQKQLRSMRPDLVEKLSDRIEGILTILLSKGTITREDSSKIRGENVGEMGKMRNLLDVLDSRGNEACKDFIEELRSGRINSVSLESTARGSRDQEPTDGRPCEPNLGQPHLLGLLEKHREFMASHHGTIDDYIANGKKCATFGERYTDITIVKREVYMGQRQHEVTEVRNSFRNVEEQASTLCECENICETLLKQPKGLTLVSGVAGSGKTTVTKKIIQEWAVKSKQGNTSLPLILFFMFRELNLVTEPMSLQELLTSHYSHFKTVWGQVLNSGQSKILLILDGLDEFKFPLDFEKIQTCTDPESPQDINGIIINIIKGNLLPDCSVLLTTRPHAICKIPEKYIQNFYQILGFSANQQKEYFQKTCLSQECADRIWEYVSIHKPLFLMCHIPAFCWIASTALQEKVNSLDASDNAATVTDIYCRFLKAIVIFHGDDKGASCVQKLVKASESLKSLRNCLKDLGALAFKGLMEQKFIFDAADLSRCNISQGSLSSIFLVEVLKEDRDHFAFQKNYHFLHTSLQEFCAALFYVMESYSGRDPFLYLKGLPHPFFHLVRARMLKLCGTRRLIQKWVRKVCYYSHQSQTGHLDLFCRFISGLLVPKTCRILEGIFTPRQILQDVQFLIKILQKQLAQETLSPERLVNVCHCLYEAQDPGLREKLKQLVEGSVRAGGRTSAADWSGLAFVLQLTNDIDLLDLEKTKLGPEGLRRLLPVLPYFRTLRLAQNPLGPEGAAILSEVLKDSNCRTERLWIVGVQLGSEGTKYICEGLLRNSSVIDLRMACNNIGDDGAIGLAEVLKRNKTLKDIRLRDNVITDEGARHLMEALKENSTIEQLWFYDNKISAEWVKKLKQFERSRKGLEIFICD